MVWQRYDPGLSEGFNYRKPKGNYCPCWQESPPLVPVAEGDGARSVARKLALDIFEVLMVVMSANDFRGCRLLSLL
jgi:hypothetical protein